MTVYGRLVRWPLRLPTARERWELPDGDFLDIDRLPGEPGAPLVIVLHGLESSSRADYVLGTLAELRARGWAGVAVNFRSCSGELNRLARFYHSGETGDLAHVVERLRGETQKLFVIGWSLGGNVVAKYLGERGAQAGIDAAVAISAPCDLTACAHALDGPGLWPKVYRERFLRVMRRKALAKAARFPGLVDIDAVRRMTTFAEFDGAVTAPLHGFSDAPDYWARASSRPLLPAVCKPLHLVFADDDPFVPAASLPEAGGAVSVERHGKGGHVAFIEGPPWSPRRYAERRAVDWLGAISC
jgi:predicted alpha/beta-fold hydrolase